MVYEWFVSNMEAGTLLLMEDHLVHRPLPAVSCLLPSRCFLHHQPLKAAYSLSCLAYPRRCHCSVWIIDFGKPPWSPWAWTLLGSWSVISFVGSVFIQYTSGIPFALLRTDWLRLKYIKIRGTKNCTVNGESCNPRCCHKAGAEDVKA